MKSTAQDYDPIANAFDKPFHFFVGSGFPIGLSTIKKDINQKLARHDLEPARNGFRIYWGFDYSMVNDFGPEWSLFNTDNHKLRSGVGAGVNKIVFEDKYYDSIQMLGNVGVNTVVENKKVELVEITLGLKINYSFYETDELQIYGSLLPGVSFWSYDSESSGFDVNIGANIETPKPTFSMLGIAGFRWFFYYDWGMYFELGVGTGPFIYSVGILGRISFMDAFKSLNHY